MIDTDEHVIEVVPPFARNVQHLTPTGDLREHVHDERGKCWCRPAIECGGDGVWYVVHNSMDGREAFERGDRQPS